MNLLPKASASRPRLACEIAAHGVIAGRSPEPGSPLAAVARVPLAPGAVVPSLKPGNIADRVAVIAALRRALEGIGARSNARRSDLSLVLPDGAVRVLLLEFDSLPSKLSEALPLVRFRLKKLIPFEPDDAMVSFQIMSTSRTQVRVLAVAIPRDVLAEYESVAREAGFEPGAVLPSTLATLAGLAEGEGASLVVNAHESGVTTAIVRAGMLLLHRSIDLTEHAAAYPANLAPALFEATPPSDEFPALSLVDREESAEEWAAQEPLPEHGRNPYADRLAAEEAAQDEVALRQGSAVRNAPASSNAGDAYTNGIESAARFPYASTTVSADLNPELHNSILYAPTAPGTLTEDDFARRSAPVLPFHGHSEPEPPVHTLAPEAQAEEIARAVSVAVAYFEDQLGAAPTSLLSAGPIGADKLMQTLREQGIAQQEGLRVRELVEPAAVAAGVLGKSVSRGALAGVLGALQA